MPKLSDADVAFLRLIGMGQVAEVEAHVAKEDWPKDHPLHADTLREQWRNQGGSFHGAAPDFVASMPEREFLEFMRRVYLSTQQIVDKAKAGGAGAKTASSLFSQLCKNCDQAHLAALDENNRPIAFIDMDAGALDIHIANMTDLRDQLKARAAAGGSPQSPPTEARH